MSLCSARIVEKKISLKRLEIKALPVSHLGLIYITSEPWTDTSQGFAVHH